MANTPQLALNPQDRQRLVTALDANNRGVELKIEKLLPAKVVQYDRRRNVATIKPLIAFVDTSNNMVSRDEVTEIPVMSMGGGGYHINFPLKPGDLGWIMASDRELSSYLATLSEVKPSHGRCHKFESGMFVPDVFYRYTIDDEDSDNMVIQSIDGQTRISVGVDYVKITTPNYITLDAPQTTINGSLLVVGDVTHLSNTTIDGNLQLTNVGVTVNTHLHTDSLGNNTSPPHM